MAPEMVVQDEEIEGVAEIKVTVVAEVAVVAATAVVGMAEMAITGVDADEVAEEVTRLTIHRATTPVEPGLPQIGKITLTMVRFSLSFVDASPLNFSLTHRL